jgi:hypothetical protein
VVKSSYVITNYTKSTYLVSMLRPLGLVRLVSYVNAADIHDRMPIWTSEDAIPMKLVPDEITEYLNSDSTSECHPDHHT